MEFLLVMLFLGLIGAAIGQTRGRAGAGLFFGLLLGPIGWLLVILGPNPKKDAEVAEHKKVAAKAAAVQEQQLAELRELRKALLEKPPQTLPPVQGEGYWVRMKDRDIGPISKLQVIELYTAGKITIDTPVAPDIEGEGRVYETLGDEMPALRKA